MAAKIYLSFDIVNWALILHTRQPYEAVPIIERWKNIKIYHNAVVEEKYLV